jgi:hypothetical protein
VGESSQLLGSSGLRDLRNRGGDRGGGVRAAGSKAARGRRASPGTDPAGPGLDGQLGTADDTTATTTTDANGAYLFQDLAAGDHLLTQTPPSGYAAAGGQVLSQFQTASVTSPATIEVTVVDPAQMWVNYLGVQSGRWEVVNADIAWRSALIATMGELVASLGTAPGLTDVSPAFGTLCVDALMDLTFEGGEVFLVDPEPLSTSLPANAGRIAYLFNRYGGGATTSNTEAAGLAAAVHEFVFDATPDLSSGSFVLNGPAAPWTTAAEFATLLAEANAFLAESAGKSELAIFLDARLGRPDPVPAGSQSLIAKGSYNFASIPAAEPGVELVKEADKGSVGPFEHVTYTYTLTNTGGVPLVEII